MKHQKPLLIVIGCCLAGWASGQENAIDPPAVQLGETPAASSPEISAEPAKSDETPSPAQAGDQSADLKTLMETAIAAAKAKDKEKLREIARNLKLPDPEKWFMAQFSEEKAKPLATDYKHCVFEERLPRFFKQMVEAGQTDVLVTCIDDAKDKEGTEGQRAALEKMKSPLKLYSVRFVRAGETQGFHVFSFAYVDGGMRCIGRLGVFSEE